MFYVNWTNEWTNERNDMQMQTDIQNKNYMQI